MCCHGQASTSMRCEVPGFLIGYSVCRNLQDRLYKLRKSHGRVQGQLSELEQSLQLDKEEVAHWETT